MRLTCPGRRHVRSTRRRIRKPRRLSKKVLASTSESRTRPPRSRAPRIWFQDEARVGQKGRITRCWHQRGERPRMVKDQGYRSAYIFGAVCPERDTGVALVLQRASTEGMNRFLEELSSQVPPRTHALVLIDNAGWHVSEDLEVTGQSDAGAPAALQPGTECHRAALAVSPRPLSLRLPLP